MHTAKSVIVRTAGSMRYGGAERDGERHTTAHMPDSHQLFLTVSKFDSIDTAVVYSARHIYIVQLTPGFFFCPLKKPSGSKTIVTLLYVIESLIGAL